VEPKPIPGRPPRRRGYSAQRVAAKALGGKRRPYSRRVTLEEHSEAFEEVFGPEGLHLHRWEGHLHPARWPMAHQKKSKMASERDEEVRGLWRWLASHFEARRLVFVDESGFNTSMTRLRARAPRGKRAYTARSRGTAPRTPPSSPRSLSPRSHGRVDDRRRSHGRGGLLEAYVEHFLAPALSNGQVWWSSMGSRRTGHRG
jgi:hypothetical protein